MNKSSQILETSKTCSPLNVNSPPSYIKSWFLETVWVAMSFVRWGSMFGVPMVLLWWFYPASEARKSTCQLVVISRLWFQLVFKYSYFCFSPLSKYQIPRLHLYFSTQVDSKTATDQCCTFVWWQIWGVLLPGMFWNDQVRFHMWLSKTLLQPMPLLTSSLQHGLGRRRGSSEWHGARANMQKIHSYTSVFGYQYVLIWCFYVV